MNGNNYPLDSQYVFKHTENTLQLSFIGLSYKSLGDITYSYQLEGLDPSTDHTSSADFANWSSVPPGNYTLRLKAKGRSTQWSPEKRIHFHILKPWWATRWFITLLIASGAAFAISIIVWILKTRERRNNLHRQLQDSELAALRAQMNPHFMFNSMNSIQQFINQNDTRSANLYLARFANLIRGILDSSRRKSIQLSKEIELLDLYLNLEKMRLGGSLDYQITKDPEVESDWIKIPAMLIQPYVENAIIHGLFHKEGEKRLSIHFSMSTEKDLHCTIQDNGIGRKKAAEIKKKPKREAPFHEYEGYSKSLEPDQQNQCTTIPSKTY